MSSVHRHGAVSSPAGAAADRRPFPFWVVQVTELVIAVVFVDVSVHVRGGGLLVAAAAAFASLAVTAEGPIGLLRLCPQRLHLALAVGIAALVAAAPLVPALRPDLEGTIVLEFGAVGLIRVATLTRASEYRAGVAGSRRRDARIIDTTASVVDPNAPRPPAARGNGGTARGTGGATGEGAARSTGGATGEGAARSAGRTAGAAAAAGRRLAAKHRPAAEAGLKRSLRQAGRWAGRLTSSPADPENRAE